MDDSVAVSDKCGSRVKTYGDKLIMRLERTMIAWFTLGVALFAIVTLAQTDFSSKNSSASLLALPVPGAPISFEQIEEHSLKDSSAMEATTTRVHRDSSGRLRIEGTIPGGPGSSFELIQIIDPVIGSRVILVSAQNEKVGYRSPFPKSSPYPGGGSGEQLRFANTFLADDSETASGKWGLKTEKLEKRIIEGIEFDGERVTAVAEDEPLAKKNVDEWYSLDLKLIGLLVASSPTQRYTAHIQNIRRAEPNPVLFAIPSGFKIIDLPLPREER